MYDRFTAKVLRALAARNRELTERATVQIVLRTEVTKKSAAHTV